MTKWLSFDLLEDKKVDFDHEFVAYLNNPEFYNELFKAYVLLKEGNIHKGKKHIRYVSRKFKKNYKSRFLTLPVIGASDEIEELNNLKTRIRLSGLQQDLCAEKIICEELKFIYIVTPKVGSRSILHYFRSNELLRPKLKITTSPLVNLLDENPEYQKYFKFGFVRNPYKRILSCYKDKILTTEFVENDKGEQIPKNDWLKYKMGTYPTFNFNMSFDDFIEFLATEHGSDLIGERHWLSQYVQMTDYKNRLLLDYVGKLENLEEDWKTVCERVGIEHKPLTQHNSTDEKIKKVDSIKYSKKSIEIIKERYKMDFQLFNYPTDFKG